MVTNSARSRGRVGRSASQQRIEAKPASASRRSVSSGARKHPRGEAGETGLALVARPPRSPRARARCCLPRRTAPPAARPGAAPTARRRQRRSWSGTQCSAAVDTIASTGSRSSRSRTSLAPDLAPRAPSRSRASATISCEASSASTRPARDEPEQRLGDAPRPAADVEHGRVGRESRRGGRARPPPTPAAARSSGRRRARPTRWPSSARLARLRAQGRREAWQPQPERSRVPPPMLRSGEVGRQARVA